MSDLRDQELMEAETTIARLEADFERLEASLRAEIAAKDEEIARARAFGAEREALRVEAVKVVAILRAEEAYRRRVEDDAVIEISCLKAEVERMRDRERILLAGAAKAFELAAELRSLLEENHGG
jgi:hypothetical protein